MLLAGKPYKVILTPWLVAAAVLDLCACRAKIEAEVAYADRPPAVVPTPEAVPQNVMREFLVQSLVGLDVDASTSGLGFDLTVPQDVVSTTGEFRLVVNLAASNDSGPLSLTFGSEEIGSLERPAKFMFPRPCCLTRSRPGPRRWW